MHNQYICKKFSGYLVLVDINTPYVPFSKDEGVRRHFHYISENDKFIMCTEEVLEFEVPHDADAYREAADRAILKAQKKTK